MDGRRAGEPCWRVEGWLDDLQFYILFNRISVTSGPLPDDNERLDPCITVEKRSPPAGLELGTARSVGQNLAH